MEVVDIARPRADELIAVLCPSESRCGPAVARSRRMVSPQLRASPFGPFISIVGFGEFLFFGRAAIGIATNCCRYTMAFCVAPGSEAVPILVEVDRRHRSDLAS